MNVLRWSPLRLLAAAFCLGLALPRPALAHLGPPFPVISDQPLPGYKLTVLANPDTTQAVAYVVLERSNAPVAPDVSSIEVWIEPADRHVARSSYPAVKETSRGTLRFFAQPNFDTVGRWYLGANVHFADGRSYRFITNVDATPPGVGRWGLLLFAAPLVAFATLFITVVIRRRRLKARRSKPQCVAPTKRTMGRSVAAPGNEGVSPK